MSTAFSSDGEVVIQKKLNIDKQAFVALNDIQLQTVYETQKCATWINQNRFSTVALQLPDDRLKDAGSLLNSLKQQVNAELVILADTSYGSCCVDEVAAQHYSADAVIHFGGSCLSPVQRLPVFYVFCGQPIDVRHCSEQCQVLLDGDQKVILISDVMYHNILGDLVSVLKPKYPNLVISTLTNVEDQQSGSKECPSESQQCIEKLGRTIRLPNGSSLEDYSILYIGSENLFLTNLIYTFNKCTFYSYNPLTRVGRQETLNVNKMLMKRYYMVEKAKDARIVGILVGTLGVANYLQVISQLKTLITQAGKKCYTFVVGKLNVAKLANFAEVDVFVLVACPLNTMFDSSEFYQPVVTPFEMELACNPSREWTGDYVTDFRELLPGGRSHIGLLEGQQESSIDISLITGGIRRLGKEEIQEGSLAQGTVVKRDEVLALANTAGEYLSGRSWQGLDPKLGQTPVEKAVQGSKGIAMNYSHEPQAEDQT